MFRRSVLAVLLVAAFLLPTAASTQASGYPTYARHLTSIAPSANQTCGALKAFIVTAWLQPGHKFHAVGTFYLRMYGGQTLKIPFEDFNMAADRHSVQWIAHGVPTKAKIDPVLARSHTTFTASPGSVWHASVRGWCYSM